MAYVGLYLTNGMVFSKSVVRLATEIVSRSRSRVYAPLLGQQPQHQHQHGTTQFPTHPPLPPLQLLQSSRTSMRFALSSPAPTDLGEGDLQSPITVNDLRVLAWHHDIDRATAFQKRVNRSRQPPSPPPEDVPRAKRRKMSISSPKRTSSPTKRQRQESPDPNATPTLLATAFHSRITTSPSSDETLDPLTPSSYAHLVNLTSTTAVAALTPHSTGSWPETTSTRTSNLSITSRTRLVPTISSAATTKSRTRSPPRNMLNEIRDVVDCHRPESEEARIPTCVHELRRRLVKGFGVRVIPVGLKEQLRKKSPAAYEDIPDYAFDNDSKLSDSELERLWRTVCGILKAAGECKDYSKDENAWCMTVVREILLTGITTPGDNPTIPDSERAEAPEPEPGILELNSVQSQSLDPRFLPTLPCTNQAISKKADFMLSFNTSHPDVLAIYRRISFGGLNIPLSPMMDDYTMRCAAFAGLEIKTAAGNTGEGLTQLAIWMAASLNNLQMLREMVGKEIGGDGGTSDLLPIAGWVVHEHDWKFYVGHKNLKDGSGRKVTVLGPFGSLNAGTDTYYGIFKLIDLVRRLQTYAREIHWLWLKGTLLELLL